MSERRPAPKSRGNKIPSTETRQNTNGWSELSEWAARENQKNTYETYSENIEHTQQKQLQDKAYDTYGENLNATQERDAQDVAFNTYQNNIAATEQREVLDTYSGNIGATQRREQDEAFGTYGDNLSKEDKVQDDYEWQKRNRSFENLITDDKEILGRRSGMFRNAEREAADKLIRNIDKAEGNKNIPSVREKYLKHSNDRADQKIARIEAKIANSPNNWFAKQLNIQRRLTIENIQYRKKWRSHYISKFEQKRQNKPEELRKKLDKIVRDKVDAMYRKKQRKLMHEQGIRSHNFQNKTEFLKNMSKDDKKKLYREAILAIRKQNIEAGVLDISHKVDENSNNIRKLGETYGRAA